MEDMEDFKMERSMKKLSAIHLAHGTWKAVERERSKKNDKDRRGFHQPPKVEVEVNK